MNRIGKFNCRVAFFSRAVCSFAFPSCGFHLLIYFPVVVSCPHPHDISPFSIIVCREICAFNAIWLVFSLRMHVSSIARWLLLFFLFKPVFLYSRLFSKRTLIHYCSRLYIWMVWFSCIVFGCDLSQWCRKQSCNRSCGAQWVGSWLLTRLQLWLEIHILPVGPLSHSNEACSLRQFSKKWSWTKNEEQLLSISTVIYFYFWRNIAK